MTIIVIKHGEEATWENIVVVKVERFGRRDGPFQFDASIKRRWGARRGDVRRLEGWGVTEHETGAGQRQKVANVLALASRAKLQSKNSQFTCFSLVLAINTQLTSQSPTFCFLLDILSVRLACLAPNSSILSEICEVTQRRFSSVWVEQRKITDVLCAGFGPDECQWNESFPTPGSMD